MGLLDEDFPSLAAIPPQLAAAKLRAVGENDAADAFETAISQPGVTQSFGVPELFGQFTKPWQQTGTAIGYIPPVPNDGNNASTPITSARRIAADMTLKEATLKITLNRFYVAQYPGGGRHRVLLHFATQAQRHQQAETEWLRFNTTCDVLDGQSAAIEDYPIFAGFNVGQEGLNFEYTAINVKNEQDQEVLDLLNADVFKTGVNLIAAFQPMLAPFSAMARALAKMFYNRNNNTSIGPFIMSFDFSAIPLRNHLAEGSYILTQLPEKLQRLWNWDEWAYHIDSGLIIKKAGLGERIPYNYLIISITRHQR